MLILFNKIIVTCFLIDSSSIKSISSLNLSLTLLISCSVRSLEYFVVIPLERPGDLSTIVLK